MRSGLVRILTSNRRLTSHHYVCACKTTLPLHPKLPMRNRPSKLADNAFDLVPSGQAYRKPEWMRSQARGFHQDDCPVPPRVINGLRLPRRYQGDRPSDLAVQALLILLLNFRAAGQTCRPGEVRVFVKDSQESLIFDAQVRLGSASTGVGLRTTSASGVVEFENVACGSWTIRASKIGFEDSVGTVQVGRESFVETTLILNTQIAHSSVDVTETAPPVEQ